jgi:hypothetical protein
VFAVTSNDDLMTDRPGATNESFLDSRVAGQEVFGFPAGLPYGSQVCGGSEQRVGILDFSECLIDRRRTIRSDIHSGNGDPEACRFRIITVEYPGRKNVARTVAVYLATS